MKKALCTILVASQWLGVWLALAQPQNDSPARQQESAVQANPCQVPAVSTVSDKPLIAVSPCRLDFGLVAVGATNYLTFTVQNVGSGTVSGFAITSPPFSISNSFHSLGCFYSLGTSQRQVVTVRYTPAEKGTNLQQVTLKVKGGADATVSVSGCGGTAPPRPTGLHVVGSGS